jgi:hypothetical protein
MEGNELIVSFLFGLVGAGMFIYGRKAGRFVPLITGGLLMAIPYFIPNWIAQLVVCSILTAVPWLIRDA